MSDAKEQPQKPAAKTARKRSPAKKRIAIKKAGTIKDDEQAVKHFAIGFWALMTLWWGRSKAFRIGVIVFFIIIFLFFYALYFSWKGSRNAEQALEQYKKEHANDYQHVIARFDNMQDSLRFVDSVKTAQSEVARQRAAEAEAEYQKKNLSSNKPK